MSDHTNGTNGNGAYAANGNGHNGRDKAFILAQPKTPDQIAREETLATMPKLRRECSRDRRLKRCVGAKWLFAQISDLTFLHSHGGDGFGRLYISIKDLKRIFGHDEGTLALWRDKLIETGWVWYRDMWPKSCWGITGVCRQPELFPPNSEYIQQAVKGDEIDERANGNLTSGLSFSAKNAESPVSAGELPGANGESPHSPLVSLPHTAGESPTDCGKVTPQKAGESPADHGRPSHSKQGISQRFAGRSRVGSLVSGQHIKESLGSNGGLEHEKGSLTPPPEALDAGWCSEMRQLFPDKRAPIERELTGRLSTAQSDDQRRFYRSRLDFIQQLKFGGKAPAGKAPVRVPKPAATTGKRMSPAEMQAHMAAAKAKAKAEAGL